MLLRRLPSIRFVRANLLAGACMVKTLSFHVRSMAFSTCPGGVNVHNEWDPIEEMIVGTSLYANFPGSGDKYFEKGFGDDNEDIDPSTLAFPMKIPQRVIEETEEDLNTFVENVKKLGIIVKRPEPINFDQKIKTFDWEVEHYFCYCPRDLHLAIGNTIIECPSGFRSRYLETFSYHKIMYEYLANGSRWISAPKGRLHDDCFDYDRKFSKSLLTEKEMIFDAANVLRLGRDIVYLVSDSANELGAKWLQSTLGPEYRVHCCRDVYQGVHIDTTMVALRPGLLLLNPKVDEDKLPVIFKKWEIIRAPDMVETEYPSAKGKLLTAVLFFLDDFMVLMILPIIDFIGIPPCASKWLGMNLLMLSPSLAAVDSTQPALIKLLESRGIDVMPTLLRHGRVLAGGPHCITLDTRRTGTLETYF